VPGINYINGFDGSIFNNDTLRYETDRIPSPLSNGESVYIAFDDLELKYYEDDGNKDYKTLPMAIFDHSTGRSYHCTAEARPSTSTQ
jgi:hypothetical protein